MAENDELIQPPFSEQLMKAEQGAEGLSRTGTGMDQHVLAAAGRP